MTRAPLIAAFGLVVAALLWTAPARAQEPDPVLAQIDGLKGEAVDAFNAYAYRKGRVKLERALVLAQRRGKQRHKKLAEVQVLLGVAAIAGQNDYYRGVHAFVRALRIDQAVRLPKALATPELQRLFVSARKTVKSLGTPPTLKLPRTRREKAADIKKGAKGLDHSSIDEAKRNFPIVVKAATGVELRVKRVFLYYRPAGKVKYHRVQMGHRGRSNVYRGSVPAQFTRGRYVHYSIEARDHRGNVVASNGSARGPNVVIIK